MKNRIIERIDTTLSNISTLIKADPASSLKKLNLIKKKSEKINYKVADVLLNLSICYSILGNIEKSVQFIEKSIELQEEMPEDKLYSETLSYYGVITTNLGNYEKSLEVLNKALTIQKRLGEKTSIIYTYIRIGNAYRSFLRQTDKSIFYYEKSLSLSKIINDESLTGLSFGSLANAYMYKKDYRKAKDYYLYTAEIFERLNMKAKECLALLGLGTILRELKEYPESVAALKKGFEISKKIHSIDLETSLSLNLAITYLLLDDKKNFRKYYSRSIKFMNKISEKTLASKLYQGLSESYAVKKDFKNAYIHFKKYFELYSGIFKEEAERVNKILRLKYEKEKSEREMEIYRLKAHELTREIESKTKELNAMASYLSQKNEFVKSLVTNFRKDFDEMNIENKVSNYLNSAVKKAETASNINEDLKRFETELDKFSFTFIEKLSKKYPKLSRVELKICSMIKINLSTKEIANLLFLSGRTVENHKYRIGKKIKLKSEMNLVTYLNSL